MIPECLNGTKKICLAITEPFAGSDVANIKCTGVKSPCGKFYIVNGGMCIFATQIHKIQSKSGSLVDKLVITLPLLLGLADLEFSESP